jgi:ketosteroid isomerase-like protein
MTANKETIETYMDGFRNTDRTKILSCLADDIEWVVPGAFHVRGKDDFAKHIVDDGFVGYPEITVSRLIETDDVVVAEGSVRAPRRDGTFLDLVFCDLFDVRNGKIRRLISDLMETK